MALIDITPIMTSNTTPSPYVATSSSIYNSSYQPYMAFDGSSNTPFCLASGDGNGWVQIDFKSINKISAMTVNNYTQEWGAVQFTLSGSNDEITFMQIDKEISMDVRSEKTIFFDKTYEYSIFRLNFMASSSYTGLSQIRLLFDDSLEEQTVENKITLHKTLKSNLPKSVKEGTAEIHFTEDGGIYISDNEGSLQKCQTGESGFQMDVLFEGSANAEGNYQLSNRVDGYKFIVIQDAVNEINNVLAEMTSNNTPVPLIATANNEYNQSYQAWKAFDNTRKDIYDCWLTSVVPAYLQIDIGSSKKTTGCYLEPRNDGASAAQITIQGSNDEVNWVDLATHANIIPLSGIYIDFNRECNYRYYKLKANECITYCAVAQFKLMATQPILHHTFLTEANGLHSIIRDDTKALIAFEKQTMNIIENKGLKIIKVMGVY